MPMDSPVVTEEAKANMEEVFNECVQTVGLCERVYAMTRCYQNAVNEKDDAQARLWRGQLGSHLHKHLPAA